MNVKLANPIREEFRISARPARSRTRRAARAIVHTLKVDPRVWRTALELADGDALRLAVVGPEEVLVLNHRR